MRSKANYQSSEILKEQIEVARGLKKADLVIKNLCFLDVFSGEFITGDVAIHNGYIVGTCSLYQGYKEVDAKGLYGVPGFIDSHVHIESSLMTPRRFEEAVLPLGTTTALWDPHEIANVRGSEGIAWALSASDGLMMDIFIMVPSCVPSTALEAGLETSGAELRSEHLAPFRNHPRVLGLAEMMNYPGLLAGDADIMAKLMLFKGFKRDGHCPGLGGKDLNAYGAAGILSCHESTSLGEAREKLQKGMHVLIREGSCAKNAKELLPLLDAYSSAVLCLCSDDRNPADIAAHGHIDAIINQGLKAGGRPADLFRAASFAAARAYGLEDRGVIAPGYLADICLVAPKVRDQWQQGFEVKVVYKSGLLVGTNSGKSTPPQTRPQQDAMPVAKNLRLAPARPETFKLAVPHPIGPTVEARVIGVLPNQIVTKSEIHRVAVTGDEILSSPKNDLLKIAVLERHHKSGRLGVALVRGFGLQEGAIATSINHDCHNVIVVGATDEAMAEAVNHLLAIDGGIVVWQHRDAVEALPLPIAGLMSDESPQVIANALARLKSLASKLGCQLDEPFLQLSFLALPVIPELKITDRGLVDALRFELVPVTV